VGRAMLYPHSVYAGYCGSPITQRAMLSVCQPDNITQP
jgi:hypothetical protein